MKLPDRRLSFMRNARPNTSGTTRRANGMARPHRCSNCQQRKMCTRVGETWLCRECRGGQGL